MVDLGSVDVEQPAVSSASPATSASVADPTRWLGALAVLSLAVQILTGILLVVYYRPSVGAAYHSVTVINDEVRLGWVMRSLHTWSGSLLILFSLLHLLRTYLARAYYMHALTWVTGILTLIVLLAFGFTGTLLPWDQHAYWSLDASRETIAAIPFIGSTLLNFFWGGWELGEEVLLRFYALHVGVLPWIGAILLSIHLVAAWRGGLSAVLRDRLVASDTFAVESVVFGLLAVGGLVSLALLFPPPLLGPADPVTPIPDAAPQWYFLPARQLLRYLPHLGASLTVLGLFALLIAVPWLDRAETPSRYAQVVRWLVGSAAVVAWLALLVRQIMS
jgi:quinol-cytochrome oxidoreductase complex cytochrome b subunit